MESLSFRHVANELTENSQRRHRKHWKVKIGLEGLNWTAFSVHVSLRA